MRDVEGFNAKLALVITCSVGTMACAYRFAAIALISLPAALSSGQVVIIVAWIAAVPAAGAPVDHHGWANGPVRRLGRALCEGVADTEIILDRLDVNTAGGIRDVLDAIRAIGTPTGASACPTPPSPRIN